MKKALSDYASGDDDTEFPAKDIDQLIVNIDSCIDETDAFLKEMGIDLDKIIAEA
jgi:type I restriction enzyme R subunit